MVFVDTHTHLYLEAFEADRDVMMSRSLSAGVKHVILPNIDAGSVDAMMNLARSYPATCLPMMGLHPTSVNENWEAELEIIRQHLDQYPYHGVGEIGIDLYWDTTYRDAQVEVFRIQLGWAAAKDLPVSIHSRDAMDLILDVLEDLALPGLKGVLHCFSGNIRQAARARDLGFALGIGGVITFKKNNLADVVAQVDLRQLVLETDAPFLAPIPYRGKRNESAYLPFIAGALADIKKVSIEEIAVVTTATARSIFSIP